MNLIFKITGIIFLITVCTSAGFFAASKITLRERRIKEFIALISELKDRIFYEGSEVYTLIKKIFGHSGLLKIDNNKIQIEDCGISASERKILNDYFERLGTTEMQGEINRAELCLSLLKEELNSISKTVAEKSRLYRILGVCAGILGCIILI